MNKFTIPGKFKQVNGTILAPENAGLRIILNICGISGKFESETDQLLTKKWMKVKTGYKEWFASQQSFKLGTFNTTSVASDIWIVNLLLKDTKDQIDDKLSVKAGKNNETFLEIAIRKFAEFVKYEKASVHIPISVIKEVPVLTELLKKYLVDEGIHTYFYHEPQKA